MQICNSLIDYFNHFSTSADFYVHKFFLINLFHQFSLVCYKILINFK